MLFGNFFHQRSRVPFDLSVDEKYSQGRRLFDERQFEIGKSDESAKRRHRIVNAGWIPVQDLLRYQSQPVENKLAYITHYSAQMFMIRKLRISLHSLPILYWGRHYETDLYQIDRAKNFAQWMTISWKMNQSLYWSHLSLSEGGIRTYTIKASLVEPTLYTAHGLLIRPFNSFHHYFELEDMRYRNSKASPADQIFGRVAALHGKQARS